MKEILLRKFEKAQLLGYLLQDYIDQFVDTCR